ncbi:MAG: SDR family oxidoreductase [Ilumatobacteraceae bacterium]
MTEPPRPDRASWSPRRRRTVLLTGATGVVGDAVLPQLSDVVCLVHRRPIERAGVESVVGDLGSPHLGFDAATYADLARRVDVVVHCAAVTDFNRRDGSLEATNVGGTERVAAFAEDAGAHLVHLSTAYLHAVSCGERGHTAVRYAASKRAAEEIVRGADVPHTILRPSIVIGDSVTGYIKAFQGLHLVAAAVLDGLVPVAPFDPAWPLDFVPSDVLADVVATVVERRVDGEFWITAGEHALPLGAAMATAEALGEELGVVVHPVRFVPPDVFDRLFAPAFLDDVPRPVRFTILKLLEFFTAYLQHDGPLPSDLDGCGPLLAPRPPDSSEVLLTSMRYWARATGRMPLLTDEVA